MPDFAGHIELYDGNDPIFDGYGIEIEIDRALERKVWLEVGRLPDRRPDGGADRGRRQHRALRRQEEPRRHDHQDQPRGGAARSPSSSACATSAASSSSTSSTWTGAHNREKVTRAFNEHLRKRPGQGGGHAHLRAGPGRDDAQAHARVAAAHADRAVHALRGQGLHQVAPDRRPTRSCASCAGRAIWSRATR